MRELMTVEEFLDLFQIGRTTFYREVAAGRLRIVKIGRATRVTKCDAMTWLNSIRKRGVAEAESS